MLPALVASQAVGYSTLKVAHNNFDDLAEVGSWPAHQYISKILKISVWVGADKVNCIETTYRLSNGYSDTPRQHGVPVGSVFTIDLTVPNGKTKNPEDQYFVGMFGPVSADINAPVLKRIGFLVYDKSNGALTPFGSYPPTEAANAKGFASLGLMVGFSGTLSADITGVSSSNRWHNVLETLAIYKLTTGADAFGISNI